jgi:hypothetical protein
MVNTSLSSSNIHIHQTLLTSDTYAPRPRCVSSALKLPDALGYLLFHVRPPVDGFLVVPSNPAYKAWPLTTLSVGHTKSFTSGSQTVYSNLFHSLTCSSPLHRLGVDFVAKSTNSARKKHNLTTPSFENIMSFTSGSQIVYSILPRSLTWPPHLHRLLVLWLTHKP